MPDGLGRPAGPGPALGAAGLRATVRTKDGWAVPHAAVTLTDPTGTQVARLDADDDGRVAGPPLPPGAYTAIVTAAGYQPQARTVLVAASGAADLGTLVLTRTGGTELPPPGPWTIDPAHSAVHVSARHLGLSTIRGRFGSFAGRVDIAEPLERSTVLAEIDAATIDTGNSLRDDHLRSPDFLDVERHPRITYRGTGVTARGADAWTVHGELTLHAVTRPVDLRLSYLGTGPDPWGGTRAAFSATTELRRDDFAINYSQLVRAGVAAVGMSLRVELEIQAVRGEELPTG
ncbi:YceI family protein [Allostreptomyces psammosilenae]|uniref:Polyisoprenoid-binding protein YceI n=1 Tax=Allostreptomyces psammosilenae TaxID=1892865 RepID=A0A852ZY67_9ACTN|nr:YceI family protein [Allostreptomyces psammosilenae]NYI06180.1 polyisoprenoid-binding protein YceI [Allostreptomyces psammosilenae]